MNNKILFMVLAWIAIPVFWGAGDVDVPVPKRGGLVLQFDDGWTSWRTLVAPELARVGGTASAFVNNKYIRNRRITMEDLRILQDEFGWEIGSHTYNHHNAIHYVRRHGLENWLKTQLESSLDELRESGLQARNLVFPFNAFTPEIGSAVLNRGVDSYRRTDPVAMATDRSPNGSLPATSIDLNRFLPLPTLMEWVDMAHDGDRILFLYGHRVLPDAAFVTGRVVSVSSHELVTDREVVLPKDQDVVLVPDLSRRSSVKSIGGLSVDGVRIRTPEGSPSLTQRTAPGATFLIGPAYGTRLSDFTRLVAYAAKRLTFYTVADIVHGRHKETMNDESGGL